MVLANNTTVAGAFQAFSAAAAGSFVWDPDNQEFYLEYAGYPGGGLLIYKGSPEVLVGRVPFLDSGVIPWAWGGGLAYDSQNHEIYAVMAGDTVETIDTVTNQDIGSIKVGNGPSGIAVDPANRNVYVTNWASNNVSVIDAAANRVIGSFYVGTNPGGIAYNPTTGHLLVTEGGQVRIVDPASGTVIGNITAGNGAEPIVYDSIDGFLYTSNFWDNNVTVINGTSERAVGSIPVGYNPLGLGVDSRHNTLYVANSAMWVGNGWSVSVVNLSTRSVFKTIRTGGNDIGYDLSSDSVFVSAGYQVAIINASTQNLSRTLVLGTTPVATVLDPLSQNLYVADSSNSWVWVVDARTGTVRSHIQVGQFPGALALDSSLGELFVANQYDGSISVINTSTNLVMATWGTGPQPWGLALDPTNGRLFESNSMYTNDVGVFDATTGNVVGDIHLGSNPNGMVYDPKNGNLYVAEDSAGVGGPIQVFNASSDRLVANISFGTAGGTLYALTVDSAMGNVYVTDYYNQKVWIVNGATNHVIGGLSVPCAVTGIAYDPQTGQVLVPSGSSEVIVLNGTSNQVQGSITVAPSMSSVAIDPSTKTVWASSGDGTVSQLVPTRFAVEVNTTARISEVGVPLEFRATIAGGSASISMLWTFGDGATGAGQSTQHVYLIPGLYVANFTVTDPWGHLVSFFENVSVLPALTLSATATPLVIDQGQALNLAVFLGGGAPPYLFTRSFGDGGPTASLTTRNLSWNLTYVYATPGVFHVAVVAQDRFVNRTFSLLVTVEPSPTARIAMLQTTPIAGTLLAFQGNVTGGIPPYALMWRYGDGAVATTWAPSSSASDTLSPAHQFVAPGNYSVELSVTDSVGESSLATLALDVHPAASPPSKPHSSGPSLGALSFSVATLLIAAVIGIAAAVVGLFIWGAHRGDSARTRDSRLASARPRQRPPTGDR